MTCPELSFRSVYRHLRNWYVCRFVNDINGDLWLEFRRDLDRYFKGTRGANRFGHVDHTTINNDTFGLAQASSDVLAGNRAIEATLAANARFKCQRYLAQSLCLLAIQFTLFLKFALFRGYTLLSICYQRGGSASGELPWQQVVPGITIRHVLQVPSFPQAIYIL